MISIDDDDDDGIDESLQQYTPKPKRPRRMCAPRVLIDPLELSDDSDAVDGDEEILPSSIRSHPSMTTFSALLASIPRYPNVRPLQLSRPHPPPPSDIYQAQYPPSDIEQQQYQPGWCRDEPIVLV